MTHEEAYALNRQIVEKRWPEAEIDPFEEESDDGTVDFKIPGSNWEGRNWAENTKRALDLALSTQKDVTITTDGDGPYSWYKAWIDDPRYHCDAKTTAEALCRAWLTYQRVTGLLSE